MTSFATSAIASFAPKWYISMDIKSYYAAIVSEQQTQFRLVRPGLTKAPGTVSIMSVEKPGRFLRHNGVILYWQLIANPLNRRSLLAKATTFTERADAFFDGFTAFESVNYRAYYITFDNRRQLYMRRFQNNNVFKESASFAVVMPTGNDHPGTR